MAEPRCKVTKDEFLALMREHGILGPGWDIEVVDDEGHSITCSWNIQDVIDEMIEKAHDAEAAR